MPTDPHAISLDQAIAYTSRWRGNMPAGAIKGARFDRIAFDNLLATAGCTGIRIYLGLKDDMSWTYVVVATDAAGKDMLPQSDQARTVSESGDEPPIEQLPDPCPPYCDVTSSLNRGTPAQ